MVSFLRFGGGIAVDPRGERGSALIAVLLLLMLMSGLAAALAVSGQTDTLVVRNHVSAAQALAAAEAGLSHAVQAVIAEIRQAHIADASDGVELALNRLLAGPDGAGGTPDTDADNGGLDLLGIPLGTRMEIAGAVGVGYEARIMDEDDPAREGGSELLDDDDADNDEDGDPLNDVNNTLVIRAVGYAADNSFTVLEAIITPVPFPALLTEADLTITGNATIDGDGGSVHTNGDLTVSGNPSVAGDASASGSYSASGSPTIGGLAIAGAGRLPLPSIRASDYLSKADFILQATGELTSPSGTVLCDASASQNACRATYGWEFNNPGWRISGNSAGAGGTFYVKGTARISGNPGDEAAPLPLTIVAEGSIEISGNPDLMPDTDGLIFVTDGDLKISGNPRIVGFGQILVHEQLQVSGNSLLKAQLIVEDGASGDAMVTENRISGNPTITYDGSLLSGIYEVSGWSDVR